jgi:hypothetical protein
MKTYGGVGIEFFSFLTTALGDGEWTHTCRYTPEETAFGAHWMEPGWAPERV